MRATPPHPQRGIHATTPREDVKALAVRGGLDPAVLRQRYEEELRPYLGRPEREDLTLQLWLEMIAEVVE